VPSHRIAGQTFNVVAENQSVKESAAMVARVVGNTAINVGPRTDDRSYSVDGSKAKHVLDFEPKHSLESAVRDIKIRLEAGYWKDSITNPIYQNMLPA
jgi:nucleoside-diphosphate-sugar epimerase